MCSGETRRVDEWARGTARLGVCKDLASCARSASSSCLVSESSCLASASSRRRRTASPRAALPLRRSTPRSSCSFRSFASTCPHREHIARLGAAARPPFEAMHALHVPRTPGGMGRRQVAHGVTAEAPSLTPLASLVPPAPASPSHGKPCRCRPARRGNDRACRACGGTPC